MIVAGFGFRGSATVDSLEQAYVAACAQAGTEAVAVATLSDKAISDVFETFANLRRLTIMPVQASDASQQATLTQSEASKTARETGSVAEASALVAAGQNARLLAARVVSQDKLATCALAQGDQT